MKLSSQLIFWLAVLIGLIAVVLLFKPILMPFVLGGAIAYLLNPIVNKCVSMGAKRTYVVLGILSLFFLLIGILLALITPILFKEAMGFIDQAPALVQKIWDVAETKIIWAQEKLGYQISTTELQTAIKDNIGKAMQVGKGVVGGLTSGGMAIIDFFTTLLLTPVAAYFLMKEWPRVVSFVQDLLPRQYAGQINDLANRIDRKISGFVRGQITVCMCLGLVYAIALTIAGLNYGFLIGLGAGILSIIPFVGSAVGLVTSLSVAYFQSAGDWVFIGIIGIIFAVGQFVEGNVITPKVMGDSVGLHPLWIIFALMAGGSLLGLLGMFLAIPVAASIGVIAAFAIEQYKHSPYYNQQGKKK